MTAPVIALPTPEPPSDIEAERTILASALDGQLAAVLESGLRPEHFYDEAHRRIFEAIVALDADGQEVTASALRTWLDERGRLHQVGGAVTLGELLFVPTELGAPLRQTIDRVRRLARSRTAIATFTSAAATLRADPRRLDAVLASTREAVEALSGDGDDGLANVTLEELTSPLPEPDWLVPELGIAPGAPTLLAGYGYSGKTMAAQEIALATICGARAFGVFQCAQGAVLHIDYEQGKRTTIERYQRMCAAYRLDMHAIASWLQIACHPRFYLDQPDAEAKLVRACRGVRLCIIDSLRASCSIEENASEIRRPLDMLSRVSERTGTVFLVIHHARKPGQGETAGSRYGIRGSGSIYDACSTVIVMSGAKGEPVKVTHEKDRLRGTPHEDFYLQIEDVPVNGNPRGGLRIVQCEAPREDEDSIDESEKFSKLRGAILAVCRNTQLRTKSAIAARVKGRKADVLQAIAELEEEGRLVSSGGVYYVK